MAIETGDLYPHASGSASLGVEQNGICSPTNDIRPFCHLHITSGVWHDPVQGQSGVIRFSVAHNAFEVSVDGGLTFDLLPASGQIDTFVDLQEAYDNGNEIDQTSKAAGPPIAGANFFVEHDPVVVRQTTPGAGLPDAHGILNGIRDASIVASGFTLTPDLLSTFAHTSIGPGYVTMQGSGSVVAPEDAGTLTLAATNNTIFGPTCLMAVSGIFFVNATGGTIWNQNGAGELVFQNLGEQGTGLGGQVRIEAFAASGRLQYRLGGVGGHEAWHWRPSYEAVGGPNSDGFHPLPHSGQIEQMIAEGGGSPHTQQAAYDGGNEIFTPLAGEAYQGVVVHEPTAITTGGPSFPPFVDHLDPYQGHTSYGLAVSGSQPLASTFGSLARLGSHWLHLRPSGQINDLNPPGLFVGWEGNSTEEPQIKSSGGLFIDTTTNITLFPRAGTVNLIPDSNFTVTAGGFISMQSLTGNIEQNAGFNWAATGSENASLTGNKQLALSAFLGSGQFEWRFGPYQAWHVNPSTNGDTEGPLGDGFFPMPHSGQILQMILENGGGGGTLQQAYNAGQRITTGANGPVHIDGDTTYGLRLDAAENDHPHILMSGVVELPQAAPTEVPGALWLQASSYGDGPAQLQGGAIPTTRAEASAKSLGIDTMFMTTGSGIVSLRAASGVSQFFNVGGGGAVDDVGKIVPLSIETTASTFYHVTSTSGVQIFVPGFYRVSYVCVLEKTLGNLAQQVDTELRVRDKWGQEFKLLGSDSSAIIRDNNTLNKNTCNGQTLTDLDPGDALVIYATHNGAVPADNRVVIPARLSNVIVEWIGPQAGGKLVHQDIG